MAQFYFLSVLLNILAGLILIFGRNLAETASIEDGDEDGESAISIGSFSLDNSGFRLVVGILCVFVALMKILSVFKGDVPVVGDLLPVLAGLISGASILLEYYVASSEDEPLSQTPIAKLIDWRKYIGTGCIAVAVLHFVFPQIIFL